MTTALYRRYRPETFQDVIGQEHVTEPLMTALRKNRVNHAYLFSGPRGCGKTTSARLLARCLNCAEGPTATPCGQCDSCRDLSRDGAGSLDVIEMDAASHGGVDHARDLRERATFAPVRDRYKIFIIDEAHMVTREGFNALLKIVEEPPEHVKFIFATTEPSKVLTTIRSRTHHYPFRLVPPEPLMAYLEQLSEQENVPTEPGVLSLVVRAGGGSVRDSLSVLDQLMAGSDDRGITYDLAVALLGYTHAALLDDVVDAFAAGDAATVFSAVDRVVQTGQDPRRFVEDLLERFRDLVVVNAVPDSAANILHGMPADQINRLRNQASQLGAAELSRAADITNTALNEMTGATSPQLHLELLCARILLPSADHTTRGITSRVDRLERRLSITPGGVARSGTSDAEQRPVPHRAEATAGASHRGGSPAEPERGPSDARDASAHETDERSPRTGPVGQSVAGSPDPRGTAAEPAEPSTPPSQSSGGSDPNEDGEQSAGSSGPSRDSDNSAATESGMSDGAPDVADQGGEIELLRASWPEIVSALAEIRRVAWTVTMRGTPVSFEDRTLCIAFDAEGDLLNFPRFENDVRAAIHSVLGIDCRIQAVRPGDTHGDGSGPSRGGGEPGGGPRGAGGGQRRPGPGARGTGQRSGEPRGSGGPHRGSGGRPPRDDHSGRHPQTRGQQSPGESETPDYFREQEGFGARRRRSAAEDHRGSAGDQGRQPSRETPGNPQHRARDSGGGSDKGQYQRANRAEQDAEHDAQEHPSPRRNQEPAEDEPVTSWSVAPIPTGEPADRSSDEASRQADSPEAPSTSAESSEPAPLSSDVVTIGSDREPSDDGSSDPAPEAAAPADSHELQRDAPTGGHEPPEKSAGDGQPQAQDRRAQQHGDGGKRTDSEYWTPHEPPPPPEDEPPADLYDFSAARPAPKQDPAPAPTTPAAQGRRPSFRQRHAAEIAAARQNPAASAEDGAAGGSEDDTFVPSAEDESIEDSSLYGRAAIERILGGLLIEERPHHTN